MARNLDPQIMSDPWFIDLDDRARLGWMMLILNGADDQGRFLLNGRLMKSMLFPADDLPAAEVLSMLENFARAGKIYSYEKDGARYGQIVKWWKFQIGSEWMAPSRHPAPDGWVDRWRIHAKGGKGIIDTSPEWINKQKCGFALQTPAHAEGSGSPEPETQVLPEADSGNDPGSDLGRPSGSHLPDGLPESEVKVKGEGKDKGEGELENVDDPTSGPAVSFENPFVVYEQNIGPLTSAVSERMKLAEADYTSPWVVDAIRLAALRNKRRWDYVEGILRNWQRDGKDDGERQEKTYAQELVAAGYTLPEQIPVEWLA
jgi:DnaD/phage-associated family protein